MEGTFRGWVPSQQIMRRSGPRLFPLTVGLLLLVLALAGCLGNGGEDSGGNGIPGIHELDEPVPAPAFSLETIDGEEFRLEDHQGKVVLLLFMGVGCSSCAANLVDHLALWEELGEDERFVFLSINSWAVCCGEGELDLRDYRDRHGIGWPMALGTAQVVQEYGVRGTPTHVFVDHEGMAIAMGSRLSHDALDAQVGGMLTAIDQ